MQFRDLNTQYNLHKTEIDNAIQKVLDKCDFVHGSAVDELEKQLAEYVGVKHCITCANGTDALQLALMAWNIGSGDIVFVPDFTFFSSGEVVAAVGATPIFVDVCADTFNIDPQKLESAIVEAKKKSGGNIRAVIAVDLFGQPADYPKIAEICKRYDLLLLEDGAQGFGGRIGERKACSFGDIGTTSFFPAKPLGCYGDGGAIFTNDDEWNKTIRSLCVHGKGTDKYDNIRIGMNSRLDTIQAAVLLEKLRFFDEEIQRCNEIAEIYNEKLKDCVKTPKINYDYYSSWAQYTVLLKDAKQREEVSEELKRSGIPSNVYYQKPMHTQEAFGRLTFEEDYSATNDVCNRCLSLPMHPYLSDEDAAEISHIIEKVTTYDSDN